MKDKNIWLIALGGLIGIGAAILYKKKKKDAVHEKPPKGAPQLDIENPGTQADFPTSATESEVG